MQIILTMGAIQNLITNLKDLTDNVSIKNNQRNNQIKEFRAVLGHTANGSSIKEK